MITQDFILKGKIAIELQKTRISIGNRIYSSLVEQYIRADEEYAVLLKLRKTKTFDRKETAKIVKKLLKRQLENQGLAEDEFNKHYKEVLKNYEPYQMLLNVEKLAFKTLQPFLEQEPLHVSWLQNVRGMGLVNSVKLLCYLRDIKRFPNPSKLRTYCGTAPNMKKHKGVEANFNPELKGFMLGQLATQFLRNVSQYKKVYDEKKAEYEAVHAGDLEKTLQKKQLKQKLTREDWTKMRIHNYSIKPMINRFLTDLWQAAFIVEDKKPPVTPYILMFPQHNPEPMIVEVSQYHSENHYVSASQGLSGNQSLPLSHYSNENHLANASQREIENQKRFASQTISENHSECASHLAIENQQIDVSHALCENHSECASQRGRP